LNLLLVLPKYIYQQLSSNTILNQSYMMMQLSIY